MQLFHSLCSSWTWHDCCPLSRQISDILNFQVWSLPVVCSCLLWYTRELILYGLVFLLWSVPKVSACAWSDLVLVFLEPRSSQQRVSVFCFSFVALNHHVCGSCALSVYQWRYKYGRLLPCLICNPVVCVHTHTQTHADPKHLPWSESQDRYSVIFPPPPASNQQMLAQVPCLSWRALPRLLWNIYRSKWILHHAYFPKNHWISLIFYKMHRGLSSFDSPSWWLRGAAGVTQLLQTPGWIPSLTHTHTLSKHMFTHTQNGHIVVF